MQDKDKFAFSLIQTNLDTILDERIILIKFLKDTYTDFNKRKEVTIHKNLKH